MFSPIVIYLVSLILFGQDDIIHILEVLSEYISQFVIIFLIQLMPIDRQRNIILSHPNVGPVLSQLDRPSFSSPGFLSFSLPTLLPWIQVGQICLSRSW